MHMRERAHGILGLTSGTRQSAHYGWRDNASTLGAPMSRTPFERNTQGDARRRRWLLVIGIILVVFVALGVVGVVLSMMLIG